MSEWNIMGWDGPVFLGGLLVFALPLTLLIPGFNVWDLVPRVRVTRWHLLGTEGTWPQLNAVTLSILTLLFCIFLEMRKRKLDEILANVIEANRATDDTLGLERIRQSAAMRACVELLDASSDHYEQLVMLRDDLRRRSSQKPPEVEPSAVDL